MEIGQELEKFIFSNLNYAADAAVAACIMWTPIWTINSWKLPF
jgi:hypothetical protein